MQNELITILELRNKYNLDNTSLAEIHKSINTNDNLEALTDKVVLKYSSKEELIKDGDYEKTFSAVFNSLETIEYIVAIETVISKVGLRLIKDKLQIKTIITDTKTALLKGDIVSAINLSRGWENKEEDHGIYKIHKQLKSKFLDLAFLKLPFSYQEKLKTRFCHKTHFIGGVEKKYALEHYYLTSDFNLRDDYKFITGPREGGGAASTVAMSAYWIALDETVIDFADGKIDLESLVKESIGNKVEKCDFVQKATNKNTQIISSVSAILEYDAKYKGTFFVRNNSRFSGIKIGNSLIGNHSITRDDEIIITDKKHLGSYWKDREIKQGVVRHFGLELYFSTLEEARDVFGKTFELEDGFIVSTCSVSAGDCYRPLDQNLLLEKDYALNNVWLNECDCEKIFPKIEIETVKISDLENPVFIYREGKEILD